MPDLKRRGAKKTFKNRQEAGRVLAGKLSERLKKIDVLNPVIYAIPRGGVPVAREIAIACGFDLDIVLAHRFSSTWRRELSLGSVTDAGDIWFAPHATQFLGEEELQEAATAEVERLRRRRADLSPLHDPISPEGREVIIVDDGIATGATAVAAVRSMKRRNTTRIIVAVPVASPRALERLREEGVEVCVVLAPDSFESVSEFYEEFSPVEDAHVMRHLIDSARAKSARLNRSTTKGRGKRGSASEKKGVEKEIHIETGDASLKGTLRLPPEPHGVVVLAHGTGANRKSPRDRLVARELNRASFGTLQLDLLGDEESADRWHVFDTNLLARRLRQATEWVEGQDETIGLPVGYFAVGTAVAAALKAASALPEAVGAVVSQGGRPDLAAEYLSFVQSPVLLVIGEKDKPVLSLHRQAMGRFQCEVSLVTVAGAGHLFEEPGALEDVARLARSWFERFLRKGASPLAPTPFEEPPGPGL